MSTTLEVRWFKPGPLPRSVETWREHFNPDPPSNWTDVYLPGEDAGFNVKVRDEKLQIKRRLAGPTPHTFGPRATGCYEQWTKWSFDLTSDPLDVLEKTSRGLWLPIEKTRRQRTFPPDVQAAFDTALPLSPPASVLLEVTTLTTPTETAWTLCLEAEGPTSSLLETLHRMGTALFDEFPLSLGTEDSFGYVRWLQDLTSVPNGPAPELPISE